MNWVAKLAIQTIVTIAALDIYTRIKEKRDIAKMQKSFDDIITGKYDGHVNEDFTVTPV